MITLVGIGHVFSIKKAIKYLIHELRPDAVCLELDRIRFDALEKGVRGSEDAPFLFRRLQKVYDKAAKTQGASVGEEMLGAAEAAKEIGVPHIFIDVEASPMVVDIFQKLSVTEKMKLIGSVLGASILPSSTLEDGIKKIGENPEEYMDQFEKAFPTLKKDIVDYRDRYMAGKLINLSGEYPHLVAVVGEGHVKGMERYLTPHGLKIIHLNEVKDIARKIEAGDLEVPVRSPADTGSSGGENVQVHFSFVIDVTDGGTEEESDRSRKEAVK
ncbi:MAG: TraB/GumN family protein [Thermoplasmatota archaeon]